MSATLYSGPGKIYLNSKGLFPEGQDGQITMSVNQDLDEMANHQPSTILRPPEPTAADLVTNFAGAVQAWVAAGAPVLDQPGVLARKAACETCPLWDGSVRFGLGKCRHKGCGCSRLMWWISTKRCPLGKWPS